MKKISAYEIALSAISCAIAAIALTVGTLYTPLLFTGYLLACFALMIPLSKNCYWGDVLAFIGAGILALMFNGFNIFDTLPFLVFFGLHPLVNALQLKFKINRWIALAVKAGSAKAVNVVLIGAMASHMQLSYETWINAIKDTVPEKFLDMNLEAFRLGYEHEKSC